MRWLCLLASLTLCACVEPFIDPPDAPPQVSRTVVYVVSDTPLTVDAPGADVSTLSRKWRGEWETDTGYRCSFDLSLGVNELGWIEGVFVWKLLDAPRDSSQHKRIGQTGREFVRGIFDPETRRLKLAGYAVDAPRLLIPDRYVLDLDAKGARFVGRSEGEGGRWIDRLKGEAVSDPG